MSNAPGPEEIIRDATWLIQAVDTSAGIARLVAMNRESYRSGSFLDDRLLATAVQTQLVPWAVIEQALADDARSDARWIFHIGHVGSTLVSRLLGDLPGVLSVREPRFLRDVAVLPAPARQRYVQPAAKLMSRTFAREEVACVKATSFVTDIAPELVPSGERALFLYATPENYIASILAGANSIRELRALEASRTDRLRNKDIILPRLRTDADRAAAAWACEMTSLECAEHAMVDRSIEWADFDGLLADAPSEFSRISLFFGFDADECARSSVVQGPLMKRYSKDPQYEYSPGLRRQLIEQQRRVQSRDIHSALAMLQSAAKDFHWIARAWARAEGT